MKKSLAERDLEILWHPFTQMKTERNLLPVVRAEGALLFTEDGKSYIDAFSSWWVNLHGHSHPKIVQAIKIQADKLQHVIFAGATHPPAVDFAEMLLKILPKGHSRIFYSDNGSTAVEVGVKMALQYWYLKGERSRLKIVALEGAYHGDTFGGMSVSGRGPFQRAFEPLLFEVSHLPFPAKGHEEETITAFEKISDSDDIAAIIVEPLIQGAAGMRMYSKDVLERLFKIAKDKRILIIADEVFTGFGRTGRTFATDFISTPPDILCLSKGITGGVLPLAATSATNEIYEAFLSDNRARAFFHGHSYTGNPLACAAAIASLNILLSEECQEKISWIASQHSRFVSSLVSNPHVSNPRSLGTIAAFEAGKQESSYFNSIRDTAIKFFLDKGIFLRPIGNTIYFGPPYSIKKEELDRIYDAALEFLEGMGS